MNRNSVYALVLAAAAASGACHKPAAPQATPSPSAAVMTEDEKTIYALGAMIGQRFAGPMKLSDKELEILQRGVKATARGGQPEFQVAEYAAKFDALARSRAALGAADNKAQATAFRDAAAAEAGAVKLASGLVYKTMKPGTGKSPKATDVVRVHYHGTLPDGKVFDSSVQRGQPAEFPLNQVIPCWTEGVQRMKQGEKAKLVCPSEIAYGDGGTPDGSIPPGATLVFEVELLEIKGAETRQPGGKGVKIHEYQGKAVLAQYGVPVPKGKVAYTEAEAVEAAKGLGLPVVVKAQIHAGGRGKGGGVKLAKTLDDCESLAKSILGMTLKTHQTGPEGRVVKRILIEQGVDLAGSKEMYLAILVDRGSGRPVFMASTQGGMDIEEVAAKNPGAILKEEIDPAVGFRPYQARKLAFGLGLSPDVVAKAVRLFTALYKAFEGTDASLVEINPFLITKAGDVLALDAKVSFDDNALFRHPELVELRDFDEEEPLEVDASKHSLNYIKLEGGSVGCMVNGAGLAMATMDIIKLAGGAPANFLDVGGGANADQIKNAFRILLADTDVRAVLINIFGGILRCDVLAEGVIAAVRDLSVKVPVVVRMKGNNEDKGQKMLQESGLNFDTADDMTTAAAKVVAAAGAAR